MNITHRLPLAMLRAVAFGYGAHAADTAGDGMRARSMDPARMTERMSERLELTPEQSASVQKINERFVADMQKQRAGMDKAREENRKAMQKLGGERDAQLKKVLSEEQYSKHAEQQAKMRERWSGHRGHGPRMHRRADGSAPCENREPSQ